MLLIGCGGGNGGIVTGSPPPRIHPDPDPWDDSDSWINDPYDDYYDSIYGDLYDPWARYPSRRIVNPLSFTQRTSLNESIELNGYQWGIDHPELHIPAELGELTISSGLYMLAHYNAIDIELAGSREVKLQAEASEMAYVVYALDGMQEDWRIKQIGLDANWYDPWRDRQGELWVGVSRYTIDGLRYDWSGPFGSADSLNNAYFHGFDNIVAGDKAYICVLLSGKAELDLSALRVGIRAFAE